MTNNTNTNEYKWMRNLGETPSFYTGPKIDHTTGTDKGNPLFCHLLWI